MCRYELITTDVEAFSRRVANGTITGSTFTVRVKYAGYLTVGFNCYDGVRKHSLNYMSHATPLRIKDGDTSMTIGFDYLFIETDENPEVPVEIEVVNEKNVAVSRSRGKNGDARGRLTSGVSYLN